MDQLELFYRFGAALGLALLVGMQREYHYVDPDERAFAGARTFALMGLLGALAALAADELGTPWAFIGALGLIGLLIVASYLVTGRRGDIGATTEMSAFIVLLVGALCYWGELALAAALTVVTTVILSLKVEVKRFVRRIDRADVVATLQLAVITAVILPILPDRGMGNPPFDVLNPYNIWLMVVFISGLSFVGYLLTQMVDARQGVGLTGLLGGLVSSTAVTLTFTQRSREIRHLARPFALAILLAWTIMFGRVMVEVAVVNRPLLRFVWLPITAAGLAGLAYAIYLYFAERTDEKSEVEVANPFELKKAIQFGALYGAILLAARAAEIYLGTTGIYLSSIIGGLTDVDAITLSMAQLSLNEADIGYGTASQAIVLAALSNTVTKGAIVLSGGSPQLRKSLLPGLIVILAAGAIVALIA